MDLGLNISDELKDLKENLEAYRCFYSKDIFHLLLDSEIKIDNQNEFTRIYTHRAAGAGDEFNDVEVEHLDGKNKAFLIYETSL